MICEELEKEITSETCTAMKKHGWCDRSCEQKPLPKNGNGGNVKSPQNNPIAIAQPSQISTITPKEVQSTGEATKTIVGHPGKEKGKILGTCGWRNNELLTWTACNQRRRKKIDICRECDQSPFIFSEPPKGRGWANSAARAIEVDCPDLGRKVKLPSCRMKQGKLVRAGKTCDVTCQYWKGEKIMVEQKTTIYWCFRCGSKEVKALGNICPRCQDAVNREEKLESQRVNSFQPDNDYDPKILNTEPVKPSYVKLVGLNSTILGLLKRWEEYQDQVDGIMIKIRNTSDQVVIELQKAVKEVEGV